MATENNLLKATLQNVQQFHKILKIISQWTSFGMLQCHEDGMTLQALDGSHISIVKMDLSRNFFRDFSCQNPVALGIHIESLCKLLTFCSTDRPIELYYQEHSNIMSIISSTGLKSAIFNIKYKSSFIGSDDHNDELNLKLMNLDMEQLDCENVYDAWFGMESQTFKDIAKKASTLDDNVMINLQSNSVTFKVEGDIGSIKRDYVHGTKTSVYSDCIINGTFSAKYLAMCSNAASMAERVCIYMRQEQPLKIEYDISGCAKLEFFIAPKMTD